MAKLNMRTSMDEPASVEAEAAIETYVESAIGEALAPKLPFEVGKSYLIRTITMIDVGKVKSICGNFITLSDASWIGDTGRFHECLLKTDVFNEVEPFKHDVIINSQSIVDATLWPYTLPTAAK